MKTLVYFNPDIGNSQCDVKWTRGRPLSLALV